MLRDTLAANVVVAMIAVAATLPSRTAGQTAAAAEGEDAPVILAIVRGLRSDRGHVRGGLYGSQETFTRGGHETATCVAPVSGGVARCRFEGAPAGRYAIGMMHDEDDDGHFDSGFLGIPEEGYGFSRDARGTLGAPSFESAAFDHDGQRTRTLRIQMRYGI